MSHHIIELFGYTIHASRDLYSAEVFKDGESVKLTFTEPGAKKGDALAKAIEWAKHGEPEAEVTESEKE